MVTTICFIDDIEQSFKEAWRVLKPNGIIIIGFVDSESKIGQTYLKRKHESVFYQDATFYSTKEVLEHLQNAGFIVNVINKFSIN
jgi:ubiquinone/menaquinone biosynthesis C-methylase UbiE